MIIDLRLTKEEAEGLLNVYNTNYAQITQYFPGKEFQLSVLFNAFRSSNVLEEHLRKKEEEEEEYGRDDLLSQISKIIGHDIEDVNDCGSINYSQLSEIYERSLYMEECPEDEEVDFIDMDELMLFCSDLIHLVNEDLNKYATFMWETSFEDFYITSFYLNTQFLSIEDQNKVMKNILRCKIITNIKVEEDDDELVILCK